MATSGSFNTTGYQGRYLTFEWSVRNQSDVSNHTVIDWTLKGGGDAVSSWYYAQNIKLTINGVTVFSKSIDEGQIQLYKGTIVASGSATLPHDAEGNRSFSAYAEAGIYNWDVNCTGSGTFTLPRILRASVPTLSASSVNFGSSITVYTNRKSTSFTHHLYYSVNGGAEVGIVPDIGNSFTWTVPYDLMSGIPSNAKSAKIMFRLYTFSGENNIGNNTVEFTATVPANDATLPTVSMTLSPVNSLPDAFAGLYIQGKSKVKAALSATGKYGATISSYNLSVDGYNFGAGYAYTSDYLSKYGNLTVIGYATDSRENTGSKSENIEVIPYSSPKIQDVNVIRCDSAGNPLDSGTYLNIVAKRSYSKVVSGNIQKNFCEIRYRYKAAAAEDYSAWVTILARDTIESDEVVTGALLGGALSAQVTYIVQVQAIDDIGDSAYTEITVPTAKVYWHRDGARRSLTFGGYVEEDNTFAIAEDITFKVKSEKWTDLGLYNGISEPTFNVGHAPTNSCHYRVVNGNHVFVSFNCSFGFSGTPLQINNTLIPTKFRPPKSVYAICPINDNYSTAVIEVNQIGYVSVISAGASQVNWIDGYIDYFV